MTHRQQPEAGIRRKHHRWVLSTSQSTWVASLTFLLFFSFFVGLLRKRWMTLLQRRTFHDAFSLHSSFLMLSLMANNSEGPSLAWHNQQRNEIFLVVPRFNRAAQLCAFLNRRRDTVRYDSLRVLLFCVSSQTRCSRSYWLAAMSFSGSTKNFNLTFSWNTFAYESDWKTKSNGIIRRALFIYLNAKAAVYSSCAVLFVSIDFGAHIQIHLGPLHEATQNEKSHFKFISIKFRVFPVLGTFLQHCWHRLGSILHTAHASTQTRATNLLISTKIRSE